jgi:hypothetical protein
MELWCDILVKICRNCDVQHAKSDDTLRSAAALMKEIDAANKVSV